MAQRRLLGNCPYCKYPIFEECDYLVCPGCEVPHHRECWQQNRGCTTFACTGERSYDKPEGIADYSFDDLVDEPPGYRLVIEFDDLLEDDTLPAGRHPQLDQRSTNGLQGYLAQANPKAMQALAMAGIVAGVITFIIARNIFNFELYADLLSFKMVLGDIMAFSALMGGAIGLCLGSVEGISSKVLPKLFGGALTGMILGIFGAALGVIIGQSIYTTIASANSEMLLMPIIVRGIHWGLVGLFVGAGQGLISGGGQRLINGMVGGAFGGFVGGILFDLFFALFYSAVLSAFISIAAFCLCIGLSIGMVQELRKEAWLKAVHGATAGKEYIIHKNRMSIGSSPQADIVLVMDPEVAPVHAYIFYDRHYYIERFDQRYGFTVNGSLTNNKQLKNGDNITIGRYSLIFMEKMFVGRG